MLNLRKNNKLCKVFFKCNKCGHVFLVAGDQEWRVRNHLMLDIVEHQLHHIQIELQTL